VTIREKKTKLRREKKEKAERSEQDTKKKTKQKSSGVSKNMCGNLEKPRQKKHTGFAQGWSNRGRTRVQGGKTERKKQTAKSNEKMGDRHKCCSMLGGKRATGWF